MAKAKIVTFTVEGGGSFPFDMLRYDACFPNSEVFDSYNLEWSGQPGLRQITLRHYVLQGQVLLNYPTEARWNSFNWRIVPGSVKRETY